jgi:hypothetical protein
MILPQAEVERLCKADPENFRLMKDGSSLKWRVQTRRNVCGVEGFTSTNYRRHDDGVIYFGMLEAMRTRWLELRHEPDSPEKDALAEFGRRNFLELSDSEIVGFYCGWRELFHTDEVKG